MVTTSSPLLMRTPAKPRLIPVQTVLVIVAWPLVLGGSLAWKLRNTEQQTMDMAYAEAKASLNKDITLRRWATEHGGDYLQGYLLGKPEPASVWSERWQATPNTI
jgi:hypothetical protein